MVRVSLWGTVGALIAVFAATPAIASFPGRNGLIAYSTAADTSGRVARIHTMRPNGTDRRPLTTVGLSRNPAWSRNGTKIAFDWQRTDDDPRMLQVMNADGTKMHRVSTAGRQAYNPTWSPNGRRLAFQGCRGRARCDATAIFVVGLRDGRVKRIAATGEDPVWSSDGDWIAYYGKFAADDECATLIRVRPSGRGRRAILLRDRDSHGTCSAGGTGADFAPDSRRLVYHGLHPAGVDEFPNPGGGTLKVWKYDPAMYTVGIDGGNRKLVATRSLERTEFFVPPFSWSPDGRQLLWRDDRGTHVANVDGSAARRIGRVGGEFAWQSLRRG